MSTAAAIKQARNRRGWSQRELAELIGTTSAAVCHYEKGNRTPRPRYAKRLELVLGLGAGALESENGRPPTSDRPHVANPRREGEPGE